MTSGGEYTVRNAITPVYIPRGKYEDSLKLARRRNKTLLGAMPILPGGLC